MRCYNCGCELNEQAYCTNCGVDVALYKKIIRTSNYFYNRGLEKAKIRDISGAIVSLRQSLKLNKNNIKARNLLGLCYFETGEVVAALSEWIISTNLKPKKNVASEYIETLQSNPARMDILKQSIKKYNQSILYCQNNSNDLAVIQLKKVLTSNPNMVRAYQLLALLYLNIGKPEPAKKALMKAQAIDVANTMTLRYLAEADRILNPEDGKKKKPQSNESETIAYHRDNEYIIQPKAVKEKKGSVTVLNILVGVFVGFMFAFLVVLPAKIGDERAKAQADFKTIESQLDAKKIEVTDLNSTVSDQEAKIAALKTEMEAYVGNEGTLKAMDSLLKAASLYLATIDDENQDVMAIADCIALVDENGWTDDTSANYKSLYYALKEAIGPKVCAMYIEDGDNAFRNEQYEDAYAYYENAVTFDPESAEALYMLANTYLRLDNTEDALKSFNKVIEKFPDSEYASRSQTRVAEIEAEIGNGSYE